MPREWIKAPLALAYVSGREDDFAAQRRICERAHCGLIDAKAERLITGGAEERERLIDKGFWWAEGHEALEQDWRAGDFSTWIDQKIEVKAFGVSFDFTALSELVPAHEQAIALRRISVSGNEDWISAASVHSLLLTQGKRLDATAVLAEACRLGQMGARAMRASCEKLKGGYRMTAWTAIEWDVPQWFWRDFIPIDKAIFQWSLNKVRGEGRHAAESQRIQLQGLHFHKSGLINLGLVPDPEADEPAPQAKRGRKAEYDWPAANAAIWGKIVRGELVPKSQAMIERALQALLAEGDKEPSESTVRPHASRIWAEYSKA